MLLSILIPTLAGRGEQFRRVHSALIEQIRTHQLDGVVEVKHLADDGEMPIGAKRNVLIEGCAGQFAVFVDDDDRVSPEYAPLICDVLRQNPRLDCVGIRGIITFRGRHPQEFELSIAHTHIYSRNHSYYRPPMHLNPVRRDILQRYRFADLRYAEDFEWALRVRDAGALKLEVLIDSPIYYYRSRRSWPHQWALDFTEEFRHRFGLTSVNRLRRAEFQNMAIDKADAQR